MRAAASRADADKEIVKQQIRNAQGPNPTGIEKLAEDGASHQALAFMAGNEMVITKDEATNELVIGANMPCILGTCELI